MGPIKVKRISSSCQTRIRITLPHTHYASLSELACMHVWIRMHTPPCMPCRHCCQVLTRFLDQFVQPIFCHFCSKLWAVFLTSPFKIFSKIFRHLATWPWDRSAAHSAQWQDLVLIFGGLLQHGAREGKEMHMRLCVSQTSGSVHACVSETHVSRRFPCKKKLKQSSFECCRQWKGFSDTHTQPVSVS